MGWEIATNLVYIGLAFICLVLSLIIDKVKIGKEKDIDLPIGNLFIVLCMLFTIQALTSNVLILTANADDIDNSSNLNNLVENSATGVMIMNYVFWIYLVVVFLRLLGATVKSLYLNKNKIKEPKRV